MFDELPVTNPRTLLDTHDEPFIAYETDLGHQVEMTLKEIDDYQVEMVKPGHQVEMAYPDYTSWYKPTPGDHQVEMAPSKKVLTQASGGGRWIPSHPMVIKKKKTSLSIPHMNGNIMEDLKKYNKDFKKFKERLMGRMLSPEKTIKAYLHWLDLGLLKALRANGQKQKTLAGWQLQVKIVLKRTQKVPIQKAPAMPPLKQLKTGARKLPQETHQ